MSDKDQMELDKLFQSGSEQHDFEYNPDAWGQMATLLDKDNRKRAFIWWFAIGVGLLLLIGVFLCFASLSPKNSDKNQAIHPLINKQTDQGEIKQPSFNKNKKEDIVAVTTAPSSVSSTGSDAIIQEKSDHSTENIGDTPEREAAVLPVESVITNERNTRPSKKQTKPPIAIFVPISTETIEEDSDDLVIGKNKIPAIIKHKETIVLQEDKNKQNKLRLVEIPDYIPSLLYSFLSNKKENIEMGTVPSLRKKQGNSSSNTLKIGILVATEVTVLGFDNITKPNFKAGVHLEYGYGRKYSLNIGANYIRKNYEAGSGEYIPPKGFWTRKIPPQSTTGVCNILEIPITLDYFFKGHQQSGFYAKAGLMSYIILRERYNYFYDLPDIDLIREWGTNDSSQYWFGISQLSFGHQKIYNNGFSKQMSAYIQTPLTGIGHGNVKMWSMGLSLKVNFRMK